MCRAVLGKPGLPLSCIGEGRNLQTVSLLEDGVAHGLTLCVADAAASCVHIGYRAASAAVVLEVINRLPISDSVLVEVVLEPSRMMLRPRNSIRNDCGAQLVSS